MADAWPASLKAIKPYIQRAKELEAANPLVSYYCNLYALKGAIRDRDPTDEPAAAIIKSLLTKCESLRPYFAPTLDGHRATVEAFALSVFDSADVVYQGGSADAGTAQAFYAAMCFLDVCGHFGELAEDLAALRKRARVYAALIARDLREGRTPAPPQRPKEQVEKEEQEDRELADELTKSLTTSGASSGGAGSSAAPEQYKQMPPAPAAAPESYSQMPPGPGPAAPEPYSQLASGRSARPAVGTTASTMYAGLGAHFDESTSSAAAPPLQQQGSEVPRAMMGAPTASAMYAGDALKFSRGARALEEEFPPPMRQDGHGAGTGPPPLPARPSAPPTGITAWLDATSGPAEVGNAAAPAQPVEAFSPPPPEGANHHVGQTPFPNHHVEQTPFPPSAEEQRQQHTAPPFPPPPERAQQPMGHYPPPSEPAMPAMPAMPEYSPTHDNPPPPPPPQARYEAPAFPAAPSPASPPAAVARNAAEAADSSRAEPPTPVMPAVVPVAGFKPDLKTVSEAQKKAKWAISALDWHDIDTAVLNLNLALSLLQTGQAPAGKAPP